MHAPKSIVKKKYRINPPLPLKFGRVDDLRRIDALYDTEAVLRILLEYEYDLTTVRDGEAFFGQLNRSMKNASAARRRE